MSGLEGKNVYVFDTEITLPTTYETSGAFFSDEDLETARALAEKQLLEEFAQAAPDGKLTILDFRLADAEEKEIALKMRTLRNEQIEEMEREAAVSESVDAVAKILH